MKPTRSARNSGFCMLAVAAGGGFKVGWSCCFFFDGFGLAGPIMSGLVSGLNGKAAAVIYIHCKVSLPCPNEKCGFGRKHQKQICSILNLTISPGNEA